MQQMKHTNILALLNKLNMGRHSALWKWRFHAMLGARTHARAQFVHVLLVPPLLLSVTLRVFVYSANLLLALR
jgi:hypothetical protein